MDIHDEVSDIERFAEQKQRSFFFFSTLALAMTVGIFGVLGGFVYGDYYGRKHAQFDNNELRQHYRDQSEEIDQSLSGQSREQTRADRAS